MKSAALLAAALLAGVLFAQGEAASLRDRVASLRRDLASRARLGRADERVARVYELERIRDATLETGAEIHDLKPSYYQPPESEFWPEPFPVWRTEAIDEFVREIAGPDADVTVRAGRLTLSAPRRVHKNVRRLLDRLAALRRDTYAVEITVVPAVAGDQERIDAVRRDLPTALADEFLARTALGRARVPCPDATSRGFSADRTARYVADYDVEVAGGAEIGEAEPSTAFEGLRGTVTLCSDRGANGALVHLVLQQQILKDARRSVDTRHGPLALPALDLMRLDTSFWAPLDRTLLVASCTRGRLPCHVLLRMRRLHP
jgi:hypothetical protein